MSLRPLFGMVIAIAMLSAPPMMGKAPLLFWNASPSVPRGLYGINREPPKVGDLVLVRLPARFAAFAARRRYLPRGALLIKPVAALAGDTVCRRGARISVRGSLGTLGRWCRSAVAQLARLSNSPVRRGVLAFRSS